MVGSWTSTPVGTSHVAKQDLWNLDQDKKVTIYHVTQHVPLVSLGNYEADALGKVRWLEGPPTTDVAHWLHRRLQHVGVKTMWSVRQQWDILITRAQV